MLGISQGSRASVPIGTAMTAPSRQPKHIANFVANGEEVMRLVGIHEQLTGTGTGRRYNVQILNKSAIVLITATWEAFVEDLAQDGLEFMISSAPAHKVFPQKVLEQVVKGKSAMDAWDLAGDGWKQALRNNFKEIHGRTIGTFNTPKTEKVNELFEKTIGLPKISDTWHWQKAPSKTISKRLDELVALRCEIAHRVSSRTVHKRAVGEAEQLILRIGVASSNAVRLHIEGCVGKAPWNAL
jgi:hypothetical protein